MRRKLEELPLYYRKVCRKGLLQLHFRSDLLHRTVKEHFPIMRSFVFFFYRSSSPLPSPPSSFPAIFLSPWPEHLHEVVGRESRLTTLGRPRRWRSLHFRGRTSIGSGSNIASRGSFGCSSLVPTVGLTARLRARWPSTWRTSGPTFVSRFWSSSGMSWIITGFARRNWRRTQSG